MSTSPTSQPRGRIVAYDALRLFAIVSVVGIHTLMGYRGLVPRTAPVAVFDDLLHYAVPLFVFISGALIWGQPWRPRPKAYRRFVARRAQAIALPWLAWSVVYALLFLATERDMGAALVKLPALLVSGHVWYHLYFVPMLLAFYVVTPLAARVAHRSPELLVILAYGLRIAYGPQVTGAAADIHPQLGQYAVHVVTHLPHMALGAWFALRLDVLPSWLRATWPALLGAGTGILGWASVNGLGQLTPTVQRTVYPVGMALTVLGFALGAIALEPRYERHAHRLTFLGSLAFGVYFVHPLLLWAVRLVAPETGADSLWLHAWFPLAIWAMVTAASFAISDVLRRSHLTAWTIGLRGPAKG